MTQHYSYILMKPQMLVELYKTVINYKSIINDENINKVVDFFNGN